MDQVPYIDWREVWPRMTAALWCWVGGRNQANQAGAAGQDSSSVAAEPPVDAPPRYEDIVDGTLSLSEEEPTESGADLFDEPQAAATAGRESSGSRTRRGGAGRAIEETVDSVLNGQTPGEIDDNARLIAQMQALIDGTLETQDPSCKDQPRQ